MKRLLIMGIICALLGLSFFLIPEAKTNYDMTRYLPENSMTKQALVIQESEFETESVVQVMIRKTNLDAVMALKRTLNDLHDVKSVVWLDDYVNLDYIPLTMIPEDILLAFYVEENALLTVILAIDSFDENIDQVIGAIKNVLHGQDFAMRGEPIDQMVSRQIAETEFKKVMMLIIPVIILVLVVVSKSWIEPVIILMTLGIAVLFNYVTHGLLGEVSYITKTLALALQLALSIDYALILIHRFYEERQKYDKLEAVKRSLTLSFKSITSSAITTILGFVALMFMQYRMGLDIGWVMSKGIVFSYLASMIVLPILLIWCDRWIQKTKHNGLFRQKKIQTTTQPWIRVLKYVVFLGLLIVGFIFQSQAEYAYSNAPKNALKEDENPIAQIFGPFSPVVLMIPLEDEIDRLPLLMDLMALEGVLTIDSLAFYDAPIEYLPKEIKEHYQGTDHERILIYTTLTEENDFMYAFIEDLHDAINNHTETYFLLSSFTGVYEIRESVQSEQLTITLLAILFVMLSIGVLFKSFLIPILLVLVIQCAIWLNISYTALLDLKIQYIGYLVIMSIQLGATIDYAILMTHRYCDERKLLAPIEAIQSSYPTSAITIIISSIILAIAGFIEGLFSDISTVQEIGFMLGRGALISAFMVLIFLPSLLLLFDALIIPKKKPSTKTETMLK